jgi:hypothetical protein
VARRVVLDFAGGERIPYARALSGRQRPGFGVLPCSRDAFGFANGRSHRRVDRAFIVDGPQSDQDADSLCEHAGDRLGPKVPQRGKKARCAFDRNRRGEDWNGGQCLCRAVQRLCWRHASAVQRAFKCIGDDNPATVAPLPSFAPCIRGEDCQRPHENGRVPPERISGKDATGFGCIPRDGGRAVPIGEARI